MPSVSLETTLELWSTTLRQIKQRIRPLFAAPSVAASANAFLDGLSEASGARPAGCGPRPPVIPVPGASRPSSAARTGMRRRCGMWCATMWSRR
jgi:hypothetical protein